MTIYRRPDGRVFELVNSSLPDGCRLCAFAGDGRQCNAAPIDCIRSISLFWRELVQTPPPPAPRLLVDQFWAHLQAAGLSAAEARLLIERTKNDGRIALFMRDRRTAGECLYMAFYWADTPEGHDYWCRMAERLGAGTSS